MATMSTWSLAGVEVTNPLDVKALYQLGDFKYQFPVNMFGRYPSRIMTCDNYKERDWLATQVELGHPVIIAPPR